MANGYLPACISAPVQKCQQMMIMQFAGIVLFFALGSCKADGPSPTTSVETGSERPAAKPRNLYFNKRDPSLIGKHPLRSGDIKRFIIGRTIAEDSQISRRAPVPQSESFKASGIVTVILDNSYDQRRFFLDGDVLCISISSINEADCRLFYVDSSNALYQLKTGSQSRLQRMKSW